MGLHTNRIIRMMQQFSMVGAGGSLCMLGVQYVHIEWVDFLDKAKRFGIHCDEAILRELHGNYPIDAFRFFEMLGFSEVHALDASDYEGADIIFDLNKKCEDNLKNRFDVIIDGGTLEHVFDIARAMKNLSMMLRCGGVILHGSPLTGYVDHGFYSISPTFYLDYYYKNGYDIISTEIEFVLDDNKKGHEQWSAFYSQDCRLFANWMDEGQNINEYVRQMAVISEVRRMLLWCMARKSKENGAIRYPMQSMWKQFEDKND